MNFDWGAIWMFDLWLFNFFASNASRMIDVDFVITSNWIYLITEQVYID